MNIFKVLSRQTWLTFILVVCIIFTGWYFYVSAQSSVPSATIPVTQQVINLPSQEPIRFGVPAYLKIPGINVDSVIEQVGLTANGALDVPKGTGNVAWYKLGPHPGEIGSAVIDGHYGIKNGKASVFDNLHKLRINDKLFVEDNQGTITTFVVRASLTLDANADATAIFKSTDGKAHLNLITCEGTWDKVAKSYPQRLVVFADKE